MYKFSVKLPRPVKALKGESQGKEVKKETQTEEAFKALEQEYQERSEAAYKFGFDDGKKLGYQEGIDEVKGAVDFLKQAAESVQQHQAQMLREADEMVVRLAVTIAARIVRKEIQVDSDIIKKVAMESLKLVEERQQISIRIHPSDWDAIKEFEQDLLSSSHGVKQIEIKEDELIERGGCLIQSNSGIVDAQIETQLGEMADTIIEAMYATAEG